MEVLGPPSQFLGLPTGTPPSRSDLADQGALGSTGPPLERSRGSGPPQRPSGAERGWRRNYEVLGFMIDLDFNQDFIGSPSLLLEFIRIS